MAMTRREKNAKEQIIDILYSEGYKTYGQLFNYFTLELTDDPQTVGYMIPGKGIICVNENLDVEQVSFVIRHEILHEFLDHALRMKTHVGDDEYNNNWTKGKQTLANMAGDWEISNLGYTDKDKITAKHLKLNGKEKKGLVTDIDHPEWINYTLEQMYDELVKEMKDEYEEIQDDLEIENPYSEDVVQGWNDFVDSLTNGKINDDDLKAMMNQVKDLAKNAKPEDLEEPVFSSPKNKNKNVSKNFE